MTVLSVLDSAAGGIEQQLGHNPSSGVELRTQAARPQSGAPPSHGHRRT